MNLTIEVEREDDGRWISTKARRVLGASMRQGWPLKRSTGGSHRVLEKAGWPDAVFAFRDDQEIGPKILARIGRRTGLEPDDL